MKKILIPFLLISLTTFGSELNPNRIVHLEKNFSISVLAPYTQGELNTTDYEIKCVEITACPAHLLSCRPMVYFLMRRKRAYPEWQKKNDPFTKEWFTYRGALSTDVAVKNCLNEAEKAEKTIKDMTSNKAFYDFISCEIHMLKRAQLRNRSKCL